ncbi:MAG: 4-hydroxythreonine-4-phosphate dehydrogenase PdxA [Rhodospirillaceae bacterium]|nr:4-hydroxythreonine-4-phosphate dehydrogenase PdxA [Rhodospirillaceae bacterium]
MSPAPIAVTMGEPAGIGGEITLRAWDKRKATGPVFFVIDSTARLKAVGKTLNIEMPVEAIAAPEAASAVFARAIPVLEIPEASSTMFFLGLPEPGTAKAVIASIDKAVQLVQSGAASAMVTNPIQKAVLQQAGFAFPGHTEYLGHLAGGLHSVMMLAVERPTPPLRVVPVTVHTALKNVPAELTTQAIVHCGRVTVAALKRDFGLSSPRLAVTGLNPHAGEDGKMGDEETRIIAPAIEQLRADGIAVTGPAPADTFFHAEARAKYDAVLCMYHDQALIPLKTLDFAGGVNITLGLPFIRTSPDHGTATDIAPKGIADPTSFLAALDVAHTFALRRS